MIVEDELARAGRRFAQDARHKASFTDRTGALIASIGFVVMQGPKQVQSDFYQANEGVLGYSKAVSYAKELAGNNSPLILVVVSGKEYAAAVDNNGSYTISGSSIEAIALLTKYFKSNQPITK